MGRYKTLLIFDIDGTLTATNEVDAKCFAKAICDYLKIDNLNTQWHQYKYSTDSGMLSEVFQNHCKREPFPEEITAIRNLFLELLISEFRAGNACTPIDGAVDILKLIEESEEYKAAIATGGWSRTANLKLNQANIPHQDLPKAYSDEHLNRTDIILQAAKKAQDSYQSDFEQMIYIGDRNWDYRASQQLGICFIGIGDYFRQANLPVPVFDHYHPPHAFLQRIAEL
ncbi:HAD family hydrolase [Legionella israelensis]|uniref:phosphoglycolate phosphatase n=1 Tax=Legionella israelensis TaxID=454 RepID=A0AAX1ECK6_9GAMM|nr:HAD hydrolase-like protein [Legionella israelensis]QBR82886.1 HAD family hydrolase [Legionella israelensis]